MPEPRPCDGELGPRQQQAVDGPYGPPLQHFTCVDCGQRHFDISLYFRNIPGTRCVWCSKWPRVAKKATVDSK
jgi:hypothetical protein